MDKREFENKIIGLLETHTDEYKKAESRSAYISQCVAIRQNLERRTGNISKKLTRKLETLKTGLSLSAQSKAKKANQLLQSYYRQAETGIDYPGAVDQVIELVGDNLKEEFLNDIKVYFDGLKTLAEKERRIIAIDTFIQNVEDGNLDDSNTIPIPKRTRKAIHQTALETSKKPNSHDYKTISESLELYYSTDLDGKKVAKEKSISTSTFSTWKISVDKKLK